MGKLFRRGLVRRWGGFQGNQNSKESRSKQHVTLKHQISLQMVHRTFCGRSALFAAAELLWSIRAAN
ncbi:MAG: hypothetical protein WBM91_16150 [Eudoraea sp.]|uniref:hypothetical protein n=1 Tax=Eudoraea sp. TaxID=1979955 RepID=UPI003C71CAAB